MEIVESDAVRGQAPILWSGKNGKIAAVCQRILQLVQGGHHNWENCPGKTHIDQGISHTEIQKLPLPLGFFRHCPGRHIRIYINGTMDCPGCSTDFLFHIRVINVPPVCGLNPKRKRRYATETCSVDINDAFQDRGIADLRLRRSASLIKGHIFPGDKGCAFYDRDFIDTVCQALRDKGDVILHSFREGQFLQPNSRKDMTFLQNQQRVKAHCLQTGRIQEGQIQARPQLLLDHCVTQPDTLTDSAKAGRGYGVYDIFRLQGRIHSPGLSQHSIRVFRLISIQRRIARPLAKKTGRFCSQLRDFRVIWSNKCRQQLWVDRVTVPLIKRQNRYFNILLA